MSIYEDNEPSLNKIEDYDGNESPSKKKTVRAVIILILIVGGFFSYLYNIAYEETKKDYIGTPDKPGIIYSKEK